jgi:hypothetical protein
MLLYDLDYKQLVRSSKSDPSRVRNRNVEPGGGLVAYCWRCQLVALSEILALADEDLLVDKFCTYCISADLTVKLCFEWHYYSPETASTAKYNCN